MQHSGPGVRGLAVSAGVWYESEIGAAPTCAGPWMTLLCFTHFNAKQEFIYNSA